MKVVHTTWSFTLQPEQAMLLTRINGLQSYWRDADKIPDMGANRIITRESVPAARIPFTVNRLANVQGYNASMAIAALRKLRLGMRKTLDRALRVPCGGSLF